MKIALHYRETQCSVALSYVLFLHGQVAGPQSRQHVVDEDRGTRILEHRGDLALIRINERDRDNEEGPIIIGRPRRTASS